VPCRDGSTRVGGANSVARQARFSPATPPDPSRSAALDAHPRCRNDRRGRRGHRRYPEPREGVRRAPASPLRERFWSRPSKSSKCRPEEATDRFFDPPASGTLFRRASFFFASATAVGEDAGGLETSLTAARVARVKRVARANAPVRLSASETAQRAREKRVFLSRAST